MTHAEWDFGYSWCLLKPLPQGDSFARRDQKPECLKCMARLETRNRIAGSRGTLKKSYKRARPEDKP